jgi:hypothetical protein
VLAALAHLWLFGPAEPDPNRGAYGGARRLAPAADGAGGGRTRLGCASPACGRGRPAGARSATPRIAAAAASVGGSFAALASPRQAGGGWLGYASHRRGGGIGRRLARFARIAAGGVGMIGWMDDAMVGAGVAAIDRGNAEDPNLLDGRARALVQGELATTWLGRLAPDAPGALQLAVRAHHLRRWVIPRSSRPEGRAGYLAWRRDLKAVHAEAVAEVLTPVGIPPETVAEVQRLVTKRGPGSDPHTQTFEDVVCLVFLETQYDALIDSIDDDEKMVSVLRKTIPKMSPAAVALAPEALRTERGAALVGRALALLG